MQMRPNCDRVYDESEYTSCPHCSGKLEEEHGERPFKTCKVCGSPMYWDGTWVCSNCDNEINSGEDDMDGIEEY